MRIELWGDEVDSIRSFDVESQRSIENLDQVHIYPANEVIGGRERIDRAIARMEKEVARLYETFRREMKTEEAFRLKTLLEETKERLLDFQGTMGLDALVDYLYEDTVSFIDYFRDKKALFVLDEPHRLMEEAQAIEQEFRESMSNRLEKGLCAARTDEYSLWSPGHGGAAEQDSLYGPVYPGSAQRPLAGGGAVQPGCTGSKPLQQ